jgi:Adenylate and Guanylate cyclase catalytic domain
MNFAARLESSGMKNKIHVSAETAELLRNAGYSGIVIPRENKVVLKGKGELQTFWVQVRSLTGSNSASSGSASDKSDDEGNVGTRASVVNAHDFHGTSMGGVIGQAKLEPVVERLVDWNAKVLVTLLEQLCCSRAAQGRLQPDFVQINDEVATMRGSRNVRDDIQLLIPLPEYQETIGQNENPSAVSKLPQVVQTELRDFVALIASGYRVSAGL